MSPHKKKVIIVTGPTASGKTAVAIQLAKYFQTEIISADSRQCYKELNIGVARPSPGELQAVKHHFIASHSIHKEISAVDFEKYALEKVKEIFAAHDVAIMVGGTGLYIKAFCEGLEEIPEIDPAIRQKIINEYSSRGIGWLQKEIKEKDPVFYETGEIQNPQRMMRALEVIDATGISILEFRKGIKAERPFTILKIGLDMANEELQRRIDKRVEEMMEKGLLYEVKALIPDRDKNALKTVGYVELFDHLDGKFSLEKAIDKIKTQTRQYAKRQLTWFRKDKEIKWFEKWEVELMIRLIGIS